MKKNYFYCLFISLALMFSLAQAQESDLPIEPNDYSLGLQAYLKNNYVQAQRSWLRAVESNNVKAMFNLGLLHQYKLIQGANAGKAEMWFMRAGENGYSAAYNHYGNYLLSQNKTDEGIGLLKKAAAQGFYPAQKKLQVLVAAPEIELTVNDALVESEVTKLSQFKEWVQKYPSSYWTIQIVAFPELQKIKDFMQQYKLAGEYVYFKEKTSYGVLYKLIYGAYSSKEEADKGRNSLAPELIDHGPWLRNIQSVKDSIKAS